MLIGILVFICYLTAMHYREKVIKKRKQAILEQFALDNEMDGGEIRRASLMNALAHFRI